MKKTTVKTLFVLFGVSLVFILTCGFSPSVALAAEPINPVSSNEISDRFAQISESYNVGDTLSEEDAAFVWENGLQDEQPVLTRGSASIYETRTAYGTTAILSGTVWHNGTFNYNFGGNVRGRITSGQTPRQMTVTVTCQAFGLVGSSTVLQYSDSVTSTSYGSRTVSMSKSKNYSGVTAVYVINTQLDVTTASGNGFTINAS